MSEATASSGGARRAASSEINTPTQMSDGPAGSSGAGPTEFDLNYYGWRVVLAACLGVMAGFGSLFVYTFAVLVKPLGAEFGWSRESVSSGFAIAAITVGLFSPLLG